MNISFKRFDVRALQIANKWKTQYFEGNKWRDTLTGSSEKVYAELLKCPDDRKAINAAIGNESWTGILCDECYEYSPIAVCISRDEGNIDLCPRCAKNTAEVLIKLAS